MNKHFLAMMPLLAVLLAACAAAPEQTFTNAGAPEQDRQAILAMAGEYAVQFDFAENMTLLADGQLHKHHSEARELVLVLEDSPEKIVLQHILVTERNHVVKHWRQDWQYQQTQLWQYNGDYSWSQRKVSAEQARGKWVQTVWQVDDSPRYAALGAWDHSHGLSRWTSEVTYRPLPRREHITRDDYNVLVGVNRHTITPTGWLHEQFNYKLDEANDKIIAHELGNNTYTRATEMDFSPARDYWKKTAYYWQQVALFWSALLADNQRVALKFVDGEDEEPHYMVLMKQANNLDLQQQTPEQLQQTIATALTGYLTVE